MMYQSKSLILAGFSLGAALAVENNAYQGNQMDSLGHQYDPNSAPNENLNTQSVANRILTTSALYGEQLDEDTNKAATAPAVQQDQQGPGPTPSYYYGYNSWYGPSAATSTPTPSATNAAVTTVYGYYPQYAPYTVVPYPQPSPNPPSPPSPPNPPYAQNQPYYYPEPRPLLPFGLGGLVPGRGYPGYQGSNPNPYPAGYQPAYAPGYPQGYAPNGYPNGGGYH